MSEWNAVIEYLHEWSFAGNTAWQYLIALGVFIGILIVLGIIKYVVLKRLQKLSKKTKTHIDDIVISMINGVGKSVYVLLALYFAIQGLVLPESVALVIRAVFLFAVVFQVIRVAEQVGMVALKRFVRSESDDGNVPTAFIILIRILLWVMGLLLILQNLGVDITSLIAGLGIGGLAASLALQNILGDIFSSFSIAIDKPFEEGDFIIVGEHMGVVKHVGLKTTRIEALQGEEIVISNTELTSARIQNFKKMQRRRIVVELGVTYDTPHDKMEKIPQMIMEIVKHQELAEFDRAHFKNFGDSALGFEFVYYMLTSEYADYMDTQQQINLQIMQQFEKEGIEFAYPTQTIHLSKE